MGAFRGAIAVAPELVWTDRARLGSVDRTTPITVTWSGGAPITLVTMEGQRTITEGSTALSVSFQRAALFVCLGSNRNHTYGTLGSQYGVAQSTVWK